MARPTKRSRLYGGMIRRSEASGDNNSCTVIASAIATGTTFEEVQDLFARNGRRHRRGVSTMQMVQNVRHLAMSLGFKVDYYNSNQIEALKDKVGANLTFNNLVKILPKNKRFILVSNDHACAVKNGRVHDWAEGRKYYVKEVIEIS